MSGQGLLCGIDQSKKSLTLATKRARKLGFANVELVESDAASFKATQPFDAALCTFAIEIIPPWRETIDMMVDSVKPGGRMGFIGFQPSSRRIYKAFNRIFRAISVPFGGVDLDRDVRAYIRKSCDEVHFEAVFGGFYYLLVGEKRAPQGRPSVR